MSRSLGRVSIVWQACHAAGRVGVEVPAAGEKVRALDLGTGAIALPITMYLLLLLIDAKRELQQLMISELHLTA